MSREPRKLSDVSFSRKGDEPHVVPSEIQEALARIGRTDDGKHLSRFLMRTYIMNDPDVGVSDGALREYVATKRLARRILQHLQGELNDDANRSIDGTGWLRRLCGIAGIRW